jgi:hypothetical protein
MKPRRHWRPIHAIAAMTAVLLLAVACGEDQGARVRKIGEESPGGTGTGAGTRTGPATGTGATGTEAATGTQAARCEPVGDSATAASSVEVTLEEWKVIPRMSETAAGNVAFKLRNAGQESHEMMVVRADSVESLPVDRDGAFDEEAVAPGSVIGEVESFPAGESCEGTFNLTPATYILLCNRLEQHDGRTVSHFKEGMSAKFTVR